MRKILFGTLIAATALGHAGAQTAPVQILAGTYNGVLSCDAQINPIRPPFTADVELEIHAGAVVWKRSGRLYAERGESALAPDGGIDLNTDGSFYSTISGVPWHLVGHLQYRSGLFTGTAKVMDETRTVTRRNCSVSAAIAAPASAVPVGPPMAIAASPATVTVPAIKDRAEALDEPQPSDTRHRSTEAPGAPVRNAKNLDQQRRKEQTNRAAATASSPASHASSALDPKYAQPSVPSASDRCVDQKVAAFRREMGPDKLVTNDILEEWIQQCSSMAEGSGGNAVSANNATNSHTTRTPPAEITSRAPSAPASTIALSAKFVEPVEITASAEVRCIQDRVANFRKLAGEAPAITDDMRKRFRDECNGTRAPYQVPHSIASTAPIASEASAQVGTSSSAIDGVWHCRHLTVIVGPKGRIVGLDDRFETSIPQMGDPFTLWIASGSVYLHYRDGSVSNGTTSLGAIDMGREHFTILQATNGDGFMAVDALYESSIDENRRFPMSMHCTF